MNKQNLILFLLCLAALLLAAAVYLIVRLTKANRKNAAMAEKYRDLELKISNLQLETLNSRLNPHLFKNVLNSIQSHAYQTYYALDKLANVLDYILYESRKMFVSPREEIEFALNLIEINKIKLSPLFDLRIKSKINENDPLYNQDLLAPLITVDLIENAFKHTDIQSPEAFISVVFGFGSNTFSLSVSNTVSGKTPLSKIHSGIGLQTLEQRLKLLYKDAFKLEKFTEDNVYHTLLKINLLEHKNQMPVTGR